MERVRRSIPHVRTAGVNRPLDVAKQLPRQGIQCRLDLPDFIPFSRGQSVICRASYHLIVSQAVRTALEAVLWSQETLNMPSCCRALMTCS